MSGTNTYVEEGSYTIHITISDVAGTTAPAVSERLAQDTGMSPTDNLTSNPALSGSGDANALVTLTEGATTLGTATADASGAWTFTPSGLADGTHVIVASETDAAGNLGTASPAGELSGTCTFTW